MALNDNALNMINQFLSGNANAGSSLTNLLNLNSPPGGISLSDNHSALSGLLGEIEGAGGAGTVNLLQQFGQSQSGGGGFQDPTLDSLRSLGKRLGLKDTKILEDLYNSGQTDLLTEYITMAMFPELSSGGGGGGGGSSSSSYSYNIGVDPAQAFNAEMGFNRDVSIANLIGEMIAQEYQRKGMQVQGGADLMQQLQQAIGMGAPTNLKSQPGFEEGGFSDRMESLLGGDPATNTTIQAFRNPERATIPFQQIADILNSIQSPDQLTEQYKPLAEKIIDEVMSVNNLMTSESYSNSGSWSGGGGGDLSGMFADLFGDSGGGTATMDGISDQAKRLFSGMDTGKSPMKPTYKGTPSATATPTPKKSTPKAPSYFNGDQFNKFKSTLSKFKGNEDQFLKFASQTKFGQKLNVSQKEELRKLVANKKFSPTVSKLLAGYIK